MTRVGREHERTTTTSESHTHDQVICNRSSNSFKQNTKEITHTPTHCLWESVFTAAPRFTRLHHPALAFQPRRGADGHFCLFMCLVLSFCLLFRCFPAAKFISSTRVSQLLSSPAPSLITVLLLLLQTCLLCNSEELNRRFLSESRILTVFFGEQREILLQVHMLCFRIQIKRGSTFVCKSDDILSPS